MKDIILEKENFIIVSGDMSDQITAGFNDGSLPKKFFKKLIFSVKQDSPESPAEYAYPIYFFADVNDNPGGSPSIIGTGLQLKKYYEDNNITFKNEAKKYNILTPSLDTEGVGDPFSSTSEGEMWRWYNIVSPIFRELNPDFVPDLTELNNLINPVTPQSAESESSADKSGIESAPESVLETKQASKLTILEVNPKEIQLLSQKLNNAAADNSTPIDKKYETLIGKFLRSKNSSDGSSIEYFGELDEGKYKSANSLEDKNQLVLESVFQQTKVNKSSLKKIIDFNKSENGGGSDTLNNQLIFFAKAPKGFKNEKNKRMFNVKIPPVVFKQVFPQSRPNTKKQKKDFSKEEAAVKSAFKKGNPSSDNMTFSDGKSYNTIIRIGDLPLYASVASVVLKDLSNKLREYDVILDNPVNLALQSTRIERVDNQIQTILKQNNIKYSDSDYVKIKFSPSFDFIGVYFVKAETSNNIAGKPSAEAGDKLSGASLFNDQTLNSLIYNLIAIYNRFGERIKQDGFVFDVQATVFFSEESIRFFLNSYIYPPTNLTDSPITADLIEKFILGDIRLLDDEVYKNSFLDPEQIPDGVRSNLQREIAQGYETIGDLLGESWFSGKFERIDDVDEFKKQLLNYIDIKDLISIASACLLKLIPLDEMLDAVCEPILKEFDKYKESIIQELDRMENGIAKDLAKELKEIYFNRVLGERGILGQVEGQIEIGIRKLPERIQDGSTLHSWRDKTGNATQTYVNLTNANYFLLNKTMLDEEVNIPLFGPSDWNNNRSTERTFVYSGLVQRTKRINDRVKELEKDLAKIQNQLLVFNGENEPQNLVDLRSYYATEISRQKQKLVQTESGILNGERLQGLYRSILRDVIPNLIVLDPYYKDSSVKSKITLSGVPYLTQKGIKTLNEEQYLKSIKELNSIRLPEINSNQEIFTFSTTPKEGTVLPSKFDFDFQIANGFKIIIDRIQQIQEEQDSPFNALATLESFGVGVLDDTLQTLFNDPTKRRYLCLAIVAAIPAAAYSIYLLFRNLDEAGEFLTSETSAITEAIERKIEILSRTNYPILDILEEFVDSLKQIGINFARDLIINGIMYILGEIKKLCSDEEKTNAPFSPLGAIDLSDFISTSRKGVNGQATGDIRNSDSYKVFVNRDATLTEEQFNSILSVLSSSLTINEIASLLEGTASTNLYDKAIRIIDTLTPNIINKESSFYKYYVNEAGIVEFFDILSRDIEPAKIARAKREYREAKQKILEICIGNDFSLLGDLNDDNVRQALANNYVEKTGLLPSLTSAIGDLFGENQTPDPCEVGVSTLTDSQKFTARQASEVIFTEIENRFNRSAVLTKDVFVSRANILNEYNDLQASNTPQSFFDFTQKNKADLIDLSKVEDNNFVAEPVRNAVKNLIEDPDYSFKYTTNEDNEKKIIFKVGTADFKTATSLDNKPNVDTKTVNFDFNFGENSLLFQYGLSDEAVENPNQSNEGTALVESIAEYRKFDYLTSSNGQIVEPSETLFGNEDNSNSKGVILQPNYDMNVKLDLSDTIYSNRDEHYLELMNSILKDLTQYSLKSGLYKKKNFLRLDLNKHITPVKLDLGDGETPIDACFLGFANKEVLHRQTEFIANLLACRNNSATRTPFNMAYIKILFDCFIRATVMQEMMKSFFVLGVFPQDLVFDQITPDNISLYEEVIKLNVIDSIESFTPSIPGKKTGKDSIFHYDTFYNNVFKQFIVDMSRIIFKNNELEDKQAYDFVVNSQIQFVKNQFKKAFQNAFGNAESVVGVSEYQLLTQEIVNGAAEAVDSDPLDLSEEFTYNERIRAIQNDTLAEYFDSTKNLQSVGEEISLGSTKTFFGGQEVPAIDSQSEDVEVPIIPLTFDKKIPLFKRISNDKSPVSPENDSPSGLVLDAFVELKPDVAAFDEEQRAFVENRLKYFGRMVVSPQLNMAVGGTSEVTKFSKELFSSTALFILVPQAIDFLMSDTLRYSYSAIFNFWDKQQGLLPDSNDYGYLELSLFYWIFRYNYDPGFVTDPVAVEWYNKMVETGLWYELNHSLIGKIKLGDFYHFLEMMPSVATYNTAIENILEINNQVPTQYKWLLDNLSNAMTPAFQNKRFFEWLFFKSVKDLFHSNTVLRIDAKLAESQSDFNITKAFSDKLFFGFGNADQTAKTDIPIQKTLLEEKIGPERLNTSQVFSAPMFELKQELPEDISCYEFFIQTDKSSWFNDDNFYNIFNIDDETSSADVAEKISNATSINEFIFSGDKKDAYSYFYRLKSFSNASHGQSQIVKNRQYLSTFWWNIKGRPVTLQAILEAIYLDFPEDEKYIAVYNGLHLTYKEIREALTPGSLRSFLVPFEDIAPLGVPFSVTDGKAEFTGTSANFASKEAGDQGVLHLTKESGFLQSSSLSIVEKIALIDQAIEGILGSIDNPGESEYVVSYDKEKGTFKEGFRPFIAIKEWSGSDQDKTPIDHGFYLWANASQSENYSLGAILANDPEANPKIPGVDFDEAFIYTNANIAQHAPLGPDHNFNRPFPQPFGHGYDASGNAITKVDSKFASVYNSSTKSWNSTVGRGTYVKGGLGYAEETILEKPVPGNILSIYDLFSKTLKKVDDKKTFNKLMESFFLKEQTTIVALINRILTEAEYPEISNVYNVLASACYKKLVIAIAVANGDYEQATKIEEPGPDTEEMLLKVGQILGEAFLKAIASTVDPTWQTPWFAPGPLTPFGIIAKLLGEDFNFGGGTAKKTRTQYPPGELVCDDSLRDSIEFFEKFTEDWQETLNLPSDEASENQ